MSKLGVVFCIAFFVASGNAISWEIEPTNLHEYVQEAVNAEISNLTAEYEDSLLQVASKATELSNRIAKFTSTISEHLARIAENLSDKLKLEVGRAEEVGVDVEDCSPLEDTVTLGKLAKAVANTTSVCIHKNVDRAFKVLDEIRKLNNDVLVKLDNVRKESKRCHDATQYGKTAVSCSKLSLDSAFYVVTSPATELMRKWTLLKLITLFSETKVYECTERDRNALYQEVKNIRIRTKRCIQNKIHNAQSATPESR